MLCIHKFRKQYTVHSEIGHELLFSFYGKPFEHPKVCFPQLPHTCKSIRNKITDQESPISLTENDNNDTVNFILYIPVIHLKSLGHNIIVKRNMISTFITAIQARPKQFCHYKPYNSAPNTFRPASEANKKVVYLCIPKQNQNTITHPI